MAIYPLKAGKETPHSPHPTCCWGTMFLSSHVEGAFHRSQVKSCCGDFCWVSGRWLE